MKNQVSCFLILCLSVLNIISFCVPNYNLNSTTVEQAEYFAEPPEEEIEVRHLVQVDLDYTSEDLRYMSCIIWCEAGNQCRAGQQAVGIVVMNRVEHEVHFADSVRGVIYETGQFSPASSGSLNKALSMYDNNTLPIECILAAEYALAGNKVVIHEEEIYNLEEILYFNGTMSNPKIHIQDHYFK